MKITKTKFSCVRDSLTIRGMQYIPEGLDLTPIIMCHGFCSSQREFIYHAEKFAKYGYAVFTFDFCGGGAKSSSDRSTKDMSVLTEQEDLKAVIRYVQQLPMINAKKDVQERLWFYPKTKCADYEVKGHDYRGVPCKIHIVNQGSGAKWKPKIRTDSKALEFLNTTDCITVTESRKVGPIIRIYCKMPKESKKDEKYEAF